MKTYSKNLCLLFFLTAGAFLWIQSAQAQGNDIYSTVASWQIFGSKIDISEDEIYNNSSSITSGTLRLQVWATSSPYTGGTIDGYVLATKVLGQLDPGYSYDNIDDSVPYHAPPGGYYYVTITVEEYTGSGWVIDAYNPGFGTYHLGSGHWGSGNPGGSVIPLDFDGTPSYSIFKHKVTINGYIYSTSESISDQVRVVLFASKKPYTGSKTKGYMLGTEVVGQYAFDSVGYESIDDTVPYTAPPSGTYYITLLLEEYDGAYTVVNYVGI